MRKHSALNRLISRRHREPSPPTPKQSPPAKPNLKKERKAEVARRRQAERDKVHAEYASKPENIHLNLMRAKHPSSPVIQDKAQSPYVPDSMIEDWREQD